MANYIGRYERLSKFMKEFMIRKVTLRDGTEIYRINGELCTITENGEKDYVSIKERYLILSSLEAWQYTI
ncbi:hypothetical protein SAMN05660649_05135 [Desulfotomaculum arcticum]|uniref:Uncharacterized protein n=1 Tax=Desulfotruncus arcticus DSM 17038 TaxID=1121424 RepID=A0A1I2ZW55_9FIRM|nr:hypothetical protein [Desulfotruncus arcticus]SFH41866.1 hypothetical protein SAMN05660649_05135 [Desulfotomaculum arcticum] [Desulfotruncus arcticus DSM 17038]